MDQIIGTHLVIDGLARALTHLKRSIGRRKRTFHLFHGLPPELRNRIWEASLSNGDVVKFETKREENTSKASFCLRRAPIPLLAVNKEARSIALSAYAPIFSSHYIAPPIYVTWSNQSPPIPGIGMSHLLHPRSRQYITAGAAIEIMPILDHPLGLPRFDPIRDLLFFVGGTNPYPVEAFGHIRRLGRQWDARPDLLPHMRQLVPRTPLEFFVIKFRNRLGWRRLARERCVRAQAEVDRMVRAWKMYGRVGADFIVPRVVTMEEFFEMDIGREMGKRYRATHEGREYHIDLAVPLV